MKVGIKKGGGGGSGTESDEHGPRKKKIVASNDVACYERPLNHDEAMA